MKVAWVTTHVPHPQGGGGTVHEFELLRHVAGEHEITVVTSSGGDASPLEELGVDVRAVDARVHPYPTSKLGVAAALLRARPTLALWMHRDRLPALRAALDALAREWRPDLVHVTLGELAPVLDGASGPTALLVFDSYARHLRRRLDLESLPRRRLQLRVELRRSETWERRWYPQATALACVSSVDAEWLDARLPRQVDVIENPIGDGYFDPPGVTRTSDTVAFVGSLLFEPNLDAVEWLIGDIWPRVVARRPLAALVVAGRSDGDPSRLAHVRRMVESVGGEVEADVPDVRPVYWRAATAIAPIRLGAGLRNKVLHAMACGAPVVATPAAVEGLPVSADEHVLVASTADAFADAIARTLDDPAAATARAGAARMVVEQFRTPRIGARLEEWWATAVAAHSDRESRR